MKNKILIIISLTLMFYTGCRDENIYYQDSQDIYMLAEIEAIAGRGNSDILFEPLNQGDTCNIEDLYIKVILKGTAIKEFPKPAGVKDNNKSPYNIYNNIDRIQLFHHSFCLIDEEEELIIGCGTLLRILNDFLRIKTYESSMMLNDFLKQLEITIPSNIYLYFDDFSHGLFHGYFGVKLIDKNGNEFVNKTKIIYVI